MNRQFTNIALEVFLRECHLTDNIMLKGSVFDSTNCKKKIIQSFYCGAIESGSYVFYFSVIALERSVSCKGPETYSHFIRPDETQ